MKATKGVFWMGLRQGVLQFLLLVKLLLVANLLGPEVFGIFGLVFLIVTLLEQFSQFGIEFALIHKQNKNEYYDTAWTIRVIRGILLFSILIIFSDTIYNVFSLETSRFVLLVVASTLLIEGFVNIGTVDFPKELQFKREFILRAVPDLANVLGTIILALLIQNIWALVSGLLIERILRLGLSYYLHDYRPRFTINRSQTVELFRYGKWIFLMGIFGFLILQAPDLIIGIALSISLLAIYQIGYKLATLPVSSMSALVASVSLPTYAKLQENEEASIRTYRITLFGQLIFFSVYASIIFPITKQFVRVILGNSWMEVIDIFKALLIVAYISIFITSIEPLFIANGLQKSLLKWQAVGILVFLFFAISILDKFDIFGLVFFFAFSMTITMIGYIYELMKLLNITFLSILAGILQILIVGLSNSVFLTLVRNTFNINSVYLIVIYGLVGFISFLFIAWLFLKFFSFDFIKEFDVFFPKNNSI